MYLFLSTSIPILIVKSSLPGSNYGAGTSPQVEKGDKGVGCQPARPNIHPPPLPLVLPPSHPPFSPRLPPVSPHFPPFVYAFPGFPRFPPFFHSFSLFFQVSLGFLRKGNHGALRCQRCWGWRVRLRCRAPC